MRFFRSFLLAGSALSIAFTSQGCKEENRGSEVMAKISGTEFSVETDTTLKGKIVEASNLTPKQKCTLRKGLRIKLAYEPKPIRENHYKIRIVKNLPFACEFEEGFVYGPHLGLAKTPENTRPTAAKQPTETTTVSDEKVISVPYLSQNSNYHEPDYTCGITSLAMLLRHFGKKMLPDDLYESASFGKSVGQSPEDVGWAVKKLLGYSGYTYKGTRALIKKQIDAGRPVVVNTFFSRSGHVVLIIGYDKTGFIFNDPYGEWSGYYKGGYRVIDTVSGKKIRYPYSWLDRDDSFDDGNIWMATGQTTPFSFE